MSDVTKNLDVTGVSRIVTCSRQEFEESYRKSPNEYTMYLVPSRDPSPGKNLIDTSWAVYDGLVTKYPQFAISSSNPEILKQVNNLPRNIPLIFSADISITGNVEGAVERMVAFMFEEDSGPTLFVYINDVGGNYSFTIPSGKGKITAVYIYLGKKDVATAHLSNLQIEIGSTATSFEPYQKSQVLPSGTAYYGSRVLKDIIPTKGYPQGRDYPFNKIYVRLSDDESQVEGIYYKTEVDSREMIFQVAKPVVRQVSQDSGYLEIQWSDNSICKYLVLDDSGSLSEDQVSQIISRVASTVRSRTRVVWREISSLNKESIP